MLTSDHLAKHFPVHPLLLVFVVLNGLFQNCNFFFDSVVRWLESLHHQEVLQGELEVLLPILSLASPVAGLGDPLWSVVKLGLAKQQNKK